MQDRVIFSTVFEGLFLRALKDRLTVTLTNRLREAGLDLDQPLQPAYPVEVWESSVDIAAELVYPELKREEAHWRLGEDFIKGYADTTLGKAAFGFLRLVGPMKAVARMERNFRGGNNFVQTKFTAVGPTCAELWLSDVHGQPWLNAGIICEGGRQVGARNVRVEILSTGSLDATYRVSWDA